MIAAVFLALALQGVEPAPHGPPEPASTAAPAPAPAGGHEAPAGEHEGSGKHGIAEILMHHATNERYRDFYVGGVNLGPSKHLLWFVIAAAAVLLLTRLAIRGYRGGHVPKGLAAAVEGLAVFVRDEIAEKNIGHDGHRFVPLLLSFFFFILVAALIGLTPFSATSTGNISVTLGLAFVSFLAMQWAGISNYGLVKHFRNMVPAGLPLWLLPIIIPVELLAMFTRPFALMIRLFANMLAGHLVIGSLLLLIPMMAGINTFFGVGMAPISLLLALFIMALEILVAFIQAYIFTLLTAIFIGMNAHPAH